jgi:hypothetical protein
MPLWRQEELAQKGASGMGKFLSYLSKIACEFARASEALKLFKDLPE